jgi:potassium efflux system protein
VLHPGQGVLKAFLSEHPTGLLSRLRYLWFPLVVGMPVLFAGLALAGYTYTAGSLTEHMIDMLWLFLALVILQQLSVRWLLLTRRRLAYKAAMEEREAAQAKESEHAGDEGLSMEVEEPEVDLAALSQESRKLLNLALLILGITGLWFIWSPVLPAFGILDDVSLWPWSRVRRSACPLPWRTWVSPF